MANNQEEHQQGRLEDNQQDIHEENLEEDQKLTFEDEYEKYKQDFKTIID